MAAAAPSEGTSGGTGYASVQRLGERKTAFDLKEIILRIVSNTSKVNLLMFSRLTHHDDVIAYSEMALNAADSQFHTLPGNMEHYTCDEKFIEGFIKHCMISKDLQLFYDSVRRYVLSQLLLPKLMSEGVACIKRVYRLAKVSAQKLTPERNISVDNREEICHMLVEGIGQAFNDFDRSYDPHTMEHYVKIWNINFTKEGSGESPCSCPSQGAELVGYLIQKVAGILVTTPQLSVKERASLVYQRARIRRIVEEDSKANPKNEETSMELVGLFEDMVSELTKPTETKEEIFRKFTFNLQHTLILKILVEIERGNAPLADFFIVLGRFFKRIASCDSVLSEDVAVYTAICDAVFDAISVVENGFIRRFGKNVWANL